MTPVQASRRSLRPSHRVSLAQRGGARPAAAGVAALAEGAHGCPRSHHFPHCTSALHNAPIYIGRVAPDAGATLLITFLTTGRSRTFETYGTCRAYCSTVGKNAENNLQNPYAWMHRPTSGQLSTINDVPPRKHSEPVRCLGRLKNLMVAGGPIVKVMPTKNMMLPRDISPLSRKSRMPLNEISTPNAVRSIPIVDLSLKFNIVGANCQKPVAAAKRSPPVPRQQRRTEDSWEPTAQHVTSLRF